LLHLFNGAADPTSAVGVGDRISLTSGKFE